MSRTLSLKRNSNPEARVPLSPADGLKPPVSAFWIVWRKNSSIARKRHETLAEATAEAHRLAELCPGRRFYVLPAIGYTQRPKPKASP